MRNIFKKIGSSLKKKKKKKKNHIYYFDQAIRPYAYDVTEGRCQLRWGSNETLPRASSPNMQPGGANPASHTAFFKNLMLARPGPRTERLCNECQ